MAMTLLQKTDMYRFFSIAFNAAPGVTYMGQLEQALAANMTTKQVVNVFTTKAEFTAVYPTFLDNATFASKLVENVVGTSATAAAKLEAVTDIQAALTSGMSRGDVVYQIFTNLAALTADAKWGATATMMSNKVAVATYYTETLATDSTNLTALRSVLAGVTATTDVSTSAALAATQPVVAIVVNTNLSVGQDTLNGTSIADTFKAMVVQNMYGAQTNQLATGDQINGGAGVDTLLATVQMANALGGGATQTIMPSTTSVEKAYFTALTVDNTPALNTKETVVINAKLMTGLTSVGSVQSDASLTIQNLTTLTDTGVYADRRNTESVTIRMDHTGNDKAVDAQSNLTVLFDNDYLVAGKTSLSSIGYWVEDREAAKLTPTTPLKKIDANGVVFTINGSTAITVTIPAETLATFLATDGTWTGYTALLQTALTVLKTGTPAVGTTAAVAADVRLANVNFSLDTSNMRILGKDATTLPVPAPAITLTSSTGDKLVAGGFTTKQQFGITYDVFTEISNGTASTTNLPITSSIELLKAGRGAEGGDLTVGAMSTDLANNFNWSTTSALKQGVEVFNISVEGDATQFSSLASLQSTNNTLKTVNVVNKAGSLADLIIGNHNTTGPALKDVQTFNAAGFANNLTVNATVTAQSIAKYMNLKDIAALPAGDNVAFAYTGGAGNDTMNINFDSTVVASRSTIVAGREDFSFTATGGAGNDAITLTMVDAANTGNTQAWYINQKLNANVSVNGGDGNDTIRTPGAGDVKIDGGAGNDTIYTDNTGTDALIATSPGLFGASIASPKAVWVLNTANQLNAGPAAYILATNEERNLADLQSGVNDSINLYKGKLTVTFKGLTKTVDVDSTGYKTSDLQLNQAIKSAINGDPVLNKLLVATDGPANTLVVTSLIDGAMGANGATGLGITIANPLAGVISAADLILVAAAHALPLGSTEATVLAAMTTSLGTKLTAGDFLAQLAETGATGTTANVEITGAASTSTSDNTVTGGLGDDVIVLGTTVGLTAQASSNEKVVYASGLFGADTIVNFAATGFGADVLDFTALGGATAGFGAALTADKSINVVTTATASNNATAVALLFNAANVAAQTHVYVAVDTATNIGTVYQVADAIGATNAVATLVGTISLADTIWATLTAVNFS